MARSINSGDGGDGAVGGGGVGAGVLYPSRYMYVATVSANLAHFGENVSQVRF